MENEKMVPSSKDPAAERLSFERETPERVRAAMELKANAAAAFKDAKDWFAEKIRALSSDNKSPLLLQDAKGLMGQVDAAEHEFSKKDDYELMEDDGKEAKYLITLATDAKDTLANALKQRAWAIKNLNKIIDRFLEEKRTLLRMSPEPKENLKLLEKCLKRVIDRKENILARGVIGFADPLELANFMIEAEHEFNEIYQKQTGRTLDIVNCEAGPDRSLDKYIKEDREAIEIEIQTQESLLRSDLDSGTDEQKALVERHLLILEDLKRDYERVTDTEMEIAGNQSQRLKEIEMVYPRYLEEKKKLKTPNKK